MAGVPWTTIISTLPGLLDAAGRLFNRVDAAPKSVPAVPAQNGDAQLSAVILRLEYFEALEADQARLLKQTLEQLQLVTLSCSAVSQRANIAIGAAVVSLIVAAAALLLR